MCKMVFKVLTSDPLDVDAAAEVISQAFLNQNVNPEVIKRFLDEVQISKKSKKSHISIEKMKKSEELIKADPIDN